MSDFRECVDFVLKNEGGFTVDTGGPTNFGITAKYLNLKNFLQYDANRSGVVDEQDIKKLTRDDAKNIYKDLFLSNSYDKINSTRIAMQVFDMCVNSGASTANKMLQNVINIEIGAETLVVDGIIGTKTIQKINEISTQTSGETSFLENYKEKRIQFYTLLSNKNPQKYQKFLKGWINRVNA